MLLLRMIYIINSEVVVSDLSEIMGKIRMKDHRYPTLGEA